MKKSPSGRSDRRATLLAVLGIAVLGGLLRAVHLMQQARELPFVHQPLLDAEIYDAWARGILAGAQVWSGPFYQSPGYPYFLAGVYAVFGANPWSGIILQSVLGVATLVFTVLLGKELFDLRTGVIAGLLVAVTGPLYFFEAKLLGTTLAVFLTVVAAYLMVLAERNTRTPGRDRLFFAAAGLVTGLLAVVRSNMILVAVFFAAYLAWVSLRGRGSWARTGIFCGAVFLALLPSLAHNMAKGSFSPLVTSGGFNFYMGNRTGANGLFKDVPGTTGKIETQEAEADALVRAELGRDLDPAAESRYWLKKGLEEIAADPLSWLALEGRKAWLLLDPHEETINGSYDLERDHVFLLRATALPFNLLAAAGILGLVLALRRKKTSREAGLLAGPAAVLAGVLFSALLIFVMARLRLPAVPVLAVFAAYAVTLGAAAWRSRHRLVPAVLALAVLGFTAATWNCPFSAERNRSWEAELMVGAGHELEKAGRTAQAEKTYLDAARVDPTSLLAFFALAELELKKQRWNEAIRMYEKADEIFDAHAKTCEVDHSNEYLAAKYNLGLLYLQTGALESCLQTADSMEKRFPDQGDADVLRAHVYLKMGRRTEAEMNFRLALDKSPRLLDAYTGLLDLLLSSDRDTEAGQVAEQASRNGVSLPPALVGRLAGGQH